MCLQFGKAAMEALLQPSISLSNSTSFTQIRLTHTPKSQSSTLINFSNFPFTKPYPLTLKTYPFNLSPVLCFCAASMPAAGPVLTGEKRRWRVRMERPPQGVESKGGVVDYYVSTLQQVMNSEMDAQSCIYDVSCDTHFWFCCDIDEDTSRALASLPGVLSVMPDPDINYDQKDCSSLNSDVESSIRSSNGSTLLFPMGLKHWLVRMDKPIVGVVSKAQMVDFYVKILAKVLRNEKDAQMCIYHISWQSPFGFCCVLDEECARELAGVPGVLSVHPDKNLESDSKDYSGDSVRNNETSKSFLDPTETTEISMTKLFVTGLSFYTSEKTLRTAFEPFGDLVEVKVIMDKISKRSKGYAFVEYSTKEAATTALQEMDGKIINGWMIVVDRAKIKPKYNRGRSRS